MNKRKQITIQIKWILAEFVKCEAEKQNISVSRYIENLVFEEFCKHKEKP